MGRLSKYGIALAPSGVISGLLKGILDLWSYDYKNPANAFRDQSIQLRNLCDDALAQYTTQLQTELYGLRQNLPQPTRENPYPAMEGIEAVKALERYIREIEALRVQVRSAVSPPNEFVKRSQAENEQFLGELVEVDRELLQALCVIDEDVIVEVRRILQRRMDRVRAFVAS
ncbi:hypothetical protein NZD89_08705 [Alicyclobacillus fastidiosus]|uniref:Uncharacterized protein n=1 Tax=Alicyclobacillus fastidiosus TaxID=392011 RepID=A0ABY6ZMM4_9BACL|nr:hypothetical protein [Alicyclobacillus fastidiosus]WAH43446.1 hypothetical protein NZD89_08705 [Alicyclobacillus fastidiosus]GMA59598.1 hypothetical protein GCM10025859_00380 [Alicyclobacillus fastidiosus]GMA65526.1 hypothetical protein GCM10025859_59660 [Alicyclobacillus fastidiosus]